MAEQGTKVGVGQAVEDDKAHIDLIARRCCDRIGMATDPAVGLEHMHIMRLRQQPGSAQPGDAAANDSDFLAGPHRGRQGGDHRFISSKASRARWRDPLRSTIGFG